jgi:hypothetical protein
MRSKKPYPSSLHYAKISLDRGHDSLPAARTDAGLPGRPLDLTVAAPPTTMTMQRTPDKLPDPWLFDSEALLRELAKYREAILLIPAMTQEAHFAAQAAIDRNWKIAVASW